MCFFIIVTKGAWSVSMFTQSSVYAVSEFSHWEDYVFYCRWVLCLWSGLAFHFAGGRLLIHLLMRRSLSGPTFSNRSNGVWLYMRLCPWFSGMSLCDSHAIRIHESTVLIYEFRQVVHHAQKRCRPLMSPRMGNFTSFLSESGLIPELLSTWPTYCTLSTRKRHLLGFNFKLSSLHLSNMLLSFLSWSSSLRPCINRSSMMMSHCSPSQICSIGCWYTSDPTIMPYDKTLNSYLSNGVTKHVSFRNS